MIITTMIIMIITMATLCASPGDGLHGAAPGCDRAGRDGGTTRLRAAGGQAQPMGQWRRVDGLVDGWVAGLVDGWMGWLMDGARDGWIGRGTGWMGGWMDGWMSRWMDRARDWLDGWVDGWVGGWMDRARDWLDGWMKGWVGGWMDEWMD